MVKLHHGGKLKKLGRAQAANYSFEDLRRHLSSALAYSLSSWHVMKTVLLTAFEPYDRWRDNASWLALIDLTRELPTEPKLVTRRYPVDFIAARQKLEKDLEANYDFVLHLGQAPGSGRVRLESIGLNVGGSSQDWPEDFQPLVAHGPVAYRSALPLARWARKLRGAGIPAQVSYHAGTYLCNALLYLTHHIAHQHKLKTKAAFVHLPLAPVQVLEERSDVPSLPVPLASSAIRLILAELAGEQA